MKIDVEETLEDMIDLHFTDEERRRIGIQYHDTVRILEEGETRYPDMDDSPDDSLRDGDREGEGSE